MYFVVGQITLDTAGIIFKNNDLGIAYCLMGKIERPSKAEQEKNFSVPTEDRRGDEVESCDPYQEAGKRVYEVICQLQQAGQWPRAIGETEEETEALARESYQLIVGLWRETCEALHLPWPPIQH
mgnify:CR=1 FL=1